MYLPTIQQGNRSAAALLHPSPTHDPPHVCAPSSITYSQTAPRLRTFIHHPRTNRPTAAHLHSSPTHEPPHRSAPSSITHARTAPPQRSFILIHPYICPLFSKETAPPQRSFIHHLLTNRPTSAHLCTIFYRGNGAVVPYIQIVAPMLSEGMYGGIRKKSIEYPWKVYRVFPKSLESIFRKSIDFSPTLPYKRSVISHPPFRCYGTTDPHPPILRYIAMGQPILIFPFLAPLLWDNRSAFLGESSLLLETTSLISR